jgi:acetyltransferase-like isoleucine patch superfamily enzyme
VIHPTALVSDGATLGEGTVVWAGAQVMNGVKTGPHCSIGAYSEVGRFSVLGDSVRISYGCFLPTRTTVGHRVFIGPRVVMTDDRYPRVNHPTYRAEPPILEDDCAIGAGAVLLPGVRIGRGATVGAGAVVTRDVEAYQTVIGNPARVYARREEGTA